jgi:uncharacterized membrane protein YraQ (UPF0718 family)
MENSLTSTPRRKNSKFIYPALLLLAIALIVPFVVGGDNPVLGTFGIVFFSIIIEAMPFVLIGSLISGIIEVFVSRERITAIVPKKRTIAILAAALLGVVIPSCECAIVPITRRLVRKGVPFSAALAYMIAGPIVNPLVAASTAVAYIGDWGVVAVRVASGYIIAVLVGLIIHKIFPGKSALIPGFANGEENGDDCGCDGTACACETDSVSLGDRFISALKNAAGDFINVSQFLIAGVFFTALMQTFISYDSFVALSSVPVLSILIMMILAVVLNLCSEADAFVAYAFNTSLPLSAQMAFMVLGPMLDIKLIAMYGSFMKKRVIASLIILMIVLVFVMMTLFHYFGEGLL